jgi:formylglycine-generating enzyme required for sulfatase activity/serine/threonine protein kinase
MRKAIRDRYHVAEASGDSIFEPIVGVDVFEAARVTDEHQLNRPTLLLRTVNLAGDGLKRIVDTLEAVAALRHDTLININALYAPDRDDPIFYCAVERVLEGKVQPEAAQDEEEFTLATLLADDNELDEEVAYDWLKRMFEGVAVLHRAGFVHGFLTTAAIKIRKAGGVNAYVGDTFHAQREDDIKRVPYAPHFQAPEFRNLQGISKASDVYSLGMIAYEMLLQPAARQKVMRRLKLDGLSGDEADTRWERLQEERAANPGALTPLREVMPGYLNDAVVNFVEKAMAPKIEDRFRDAQEALEELNKIINEDTVIIASRKKKRQVEIDDEDEDGPEKAEEPDTPKPKKRWPLYAAAGFAATVSIVMLVMWMMDRSEISGKLEQAQKTLTDLQAAGAAEAEGYDAAVKQLEVAKAEFSGFSLGQARKDVDAVLVNFGKLSIKVTELRDQAMSAKQSAENVQAAVAKLGLAQKPAAVDAAKRHSSGVDALEHKAWVSAAAAFHDEEHTLGDLIAENERQKAAISAYRRKINPLMQRAETVGAAETRPYSRFIADLATAKGHEENGRLDQALVAFQSSETELKAAFDEVEAQSAPAKKKYDALIAEQAVLEKSPIANRKEVLDTRAKLTDADKRIQAGAYGLALASLGGVEAAQKDVHALFDRLQCKLNDGPPLARLPAGTHKFGLWRAGKIYQENVVTIVPELREGILAVPVDLCIQARPVSISEFRQFVAASAPGDREKIRSWVTQSAWPKVEATGGAGADDPVTVTHTGAEAFIVWFTEKTGRKYRLPTPVEWLAALSTAETTKNQFLLSSMSAKTRDWTAKACKQGSWLTLGEADGQSDVRGACVIDDAPGGRSLGIRLVLAVE